MNSKTWIELLPREISPRLAVFISGGKQTKALLNFAETHPSFAEAALVSLSYRLDLVCSSSEDSSVKRWVTICPPRAKEITVGGDTPDAELLQPYLSLSPMLHCKLQGWNESRFRCIMACNSLKELRLDAHYSSAYMLVQTLSGLDLDKLALLCTCDYDPSDDEYYYHENDDEDCDDCDCDLKRCIYYEYTFCNSSFNAISVCCPNLRELETSSCSCGTLSGPRSTFPFLNGFTSWQKYVITGEGDYNVPASFRSELPEIARISLINCEDVDDGLSFGTQLMEFGTLQCLEVSQIMRLGECTQLEELHFNAPSGAEKVLLGVLAKLPILGTLDVTWEPHGSSDDCITLQTGAVLSTVKAAPNLTKFKFENAKIPAEELESVLGHMGSRLKVFWTSLLQQHESVVQRFERLVVLLIRHNENLEEIGFEGHSLTRPKITMKIQEYRPMELAVKLLKSHRPRIGIFDHSETFDSVDSMEE